MVFLLQQKENRIKMIRRQAIEYLKNNPLGYGRMLGFNKLGVLYLLD